MAKLNVVALWFNTNNFDFILDLVSKKLNHLAIILHVYARGLNFMKQKKLLLFFKKKMEILLHFNQF